MFINELNSVNPEEESYSSDVCFIGTFTRRRANVIRSLSKAGIRRVWGPYWKTFFGDSRNVNDGVYGPEDGQGL